MPRPKGLSERKRYTVRLLDSELDAIQEKADVALLTVSEYIRRCALGKRIHSRINVQAMAQQAKLAGLMKHLIMTSPENRAELNGVIAELKATTKQLAKLGD